MPLTILYKYGNCTSYIIVRLERMLDYRGVRLERFHSMHMSSLRSHQITPMPFAHTVLVNHAMWST